jgi:hypothetical protein
MNLVMILQYGNTKISIQHNKLIVSFKHCLSFHEKKKKGKKSYLALKFSSDLDLVLRFLISKIRFLSFAQVSKLSIYYFTVKVNDILLSHVFHLTL